MSTDCENCAAPCCNNLFVTHYHEETKETHEEDRARVLQTWAASGAALVPIALNANGFVEWECRAFDKIKLRCGVYEDRPDTCCRYDCTLDPYAYQNPAMCLLPEGWGKRGGPGRL